MFEEWIEFRHKGLTLNQIGYEYPHPQSDQLLVYRGWRGGVPGQAYDYRPYFDNAKRIAEWLKNTKQQRITVRYRRQSTYRSSRPLVSSIEVVHHKPRVHTVRWT